MEQLPAEFSWPVGNDVHVIPVADASNAYAAVTVKRDNLVFAVVAAYVRIWLLLR